MSTGSYTPKPPSGGIPKPPPQTTIINGPVISTPTEGYPQQNGSPTPISEGIQVQPPINQPSAYTYTVTPPGGDSVTFNNPDAARRYIESLAEPIIAKNQQLTTQRRETTPVSTVKPEDIPGGRSFFVDAPGMEEYAAGVTSKLPQAKSSSELEAGALDAFLSGVSFEITESGLKAADMAKEAKIEGRNAWAGVLYGFSTAAGAVKAGYDIGTFFLRPELVKESIDSLPAVGEEVAKFFTMSPAGYVRNVLDNADERSGFALGYYGTQAAFAGAGLADFTQSVKARFSVKGKIPPPAKIQGKVVETWKSPTEPDFAIVKVRQSDGTVKLYLKNIKSAEAAARQGGYELVELLDADGQPRLYLRSGADLIPTTEGLTQLFETVAPEAVVSSVSGRSLVDLTVLGASVAPKILTPSADLVMPDVEPDLEELDDEDVVVTPIVLPQEIVDTLPVIDQPQDDIQDPQQDVIQDPQQDVIQDPITDMIQDPVQDIVETPVTETIQSPDLEPPGDKRGGFARDEQPRTLEQKKGGTAARGRFRVVLDGRVSTVVAGGFVEALSIVSGGRGGRATVTRIS